MGGCDTQLFGLLCRWCSGSGGAGLGALALDPGLDAGHAGDEGLAPCVKENEVKQSELQKGHRSDGGGG